ncbi:MAG: anti-sigma factor [Pseudomonadota bacterium]
MTQGPTDTPETGPDRERILAAEYSLGLLEGEELLAARGRMASDPEFAARREWWDEWFVPLTDEVAGAEPGAHVWDAIATQVSPPAAAEPVSTGAPAASNVVLLDMERKVRRWQWTAGLTSAAAAVALALFATSPSVDAVPDTTPTLAATEAPLMASIPVGETLRLGVTYLPESEEMLVSAAGLAADGVHDHELWLVPGDGSALQSLGVVVPGEERRVTLAADVARNMADGASLVLTREPIGGKPDGVGAGPVVAQGAFAAV